MTTNRAGKTANSKSSSVDSADSQPTDDSVIKVQLQALLIALKAADRKSVV